MGNKTFKKTKFEIIGQTEDGHKVIKGDRVFLLMESRGVPLDIILYVLKSRGYIIDWISFFEEGFERALWKPQTIFNRIESVCADVFGNKYSKEVIKRLSYYVRKEKLKEGI